MKLACCDKCHDVFKLQKYLQFCRCGNISGNYVDNLKAEIYRKDKISCRVIGVENGVRYGLKERGEVWVQHPGDIETGANLEEPETAILIKLKYKSPKLKKLNTVNR